MAKPLPRRATAIVGMVLAWAGCAEPNAESPNEHSSTVDTSALLTELVMLAASEGQIVLDVSGERALAGHLLPAPENADPDRTLTLHTRGLTPALGAALDGLVVTDAALSDDGVFVIERDHTLAFFDGSGARLPLDAQAFGPLSAVGGRVAYVRGEPPWLEVVVFDVETGAIIAPAPDLPMAWSPALGADGETLVFVASVGGSSRLVRARLGGGSEVLGPTERTPSAPTPPRLDLSRDTLLFEDEAGVVELDLRTLEPRRVFEGVHGHLSLRDAAVLARSAGGLLSPLTESSRAPGSLVEAP